MARGHGRVERREGAGDAARRGGASVGHGGGARRGGSPHRADNTHAKFAGVMAVGRDVPIAPPG